MREEGKTEGRERERRGKTEVGKQIDKDKLRRGMRVRGEGKKRGRGRGRSGKTEVEETE